MWRDNPLDGLGGRESDRFLIDNASTAPLSSLFQLDRLNLKETVTADESMDDGCLSDAASTTLCKLDDTSNVKVAVRIRPLGEDQQHVIHLTNSKVVSIAKPAKRQLQYLKSQQATRNEYAFDAAFGPESQQEEIYSAAARPIIDKVMGGVNGTVFAYGATGAGKTFTMLGGGGGTGTTGEEEGIIGRAIRDVFKAKARLEEEAEGRQEDYLDPDLGAAGAGGGASTTKQVNVRVAVSFMEVYNESIRDLLSPSGQVCEVQEDLSEVKVSGLTEVEVFDAESALQALQRGSRLRKMESTAANKVSSRSHAVFQLVVSSEVTTTTRTTPSSSSASAVVGAGGEQTTGRGGKRHRTQNNQGGGNGNGSGGAAGVTVKKRAKLSLIDLAGSERACVTQNRGAQLREGAHINRSLLALANCINALGSRADREFHKKEKENTQHSNQGLSASGVGGLPGGGGASKGAGGALAKVKYRDSKLTHLLKNSLEGDCLVVMIANVHPGVLAYEESHNTLKYANRAKNIRLQPQTHSQCTMQQVPSQPLAVMNAQQQQGGGGGGGGDCRDKERGPYPRGFEGASTSPPRFGPPDSSAVVEGGARGLEDDTVGQGGTWRGTGRGRERPEEEDEESDGPPPTVLRHRSGGRGEEGVLSEEADLREREEEKERDGGGNWNPALEGSARKRRRQNEGTVESAGEVHPLPLPLHNREREGATRPAPPLRSGDLQALCDSQRDVISQLRSALSTAIEEKERLRQEVAERDTTIAERDARILRLADAVLRANRTGSAGAGAPPGPGASAGHPGGPSDYQAPTHRRAEREPKGRREGEGDGASGGGGACSGSLTLLREKERERKVRQALLREKAKEKEKSVGGLHTEGEGNGDEGAERGKDGDLKGPGGSRGGRGGVPSSGVHLFSSSAAPQYQHPQQQRGGFGGTSGRHLSEGHGGSGSLIGEVAASVSASGDAPPTSRLRAARASVKAQISKAALSNLCPSSSSSSSTGPAASGFSNSNWVGGDPAMMQSGRPGWGGIEGSLDVVMEEPSEQGGIGGGEFEKTRDF
uniref:Kinesin motor domain-containing protein n=1 Tax=Chromera velia CCMP2878 TaxID=1169474 RepID=A0A0G4FD88_9ALVE|eukprot:Cvel_16322.t1-p1 / transcript=Cvel_16322.t1 / gene=Cvel_16322 / organism=Chromera_velia_CCMP2878 / gene_product=Kinesin-like protein unc-104, putative / transcript_product=Kinesin-like protein unc-104, putative / location=Cvel_scaffold1252:39385-49766(-) / protein_length=1049 / sequence_SO=supercontig / SO=protein_coding / is_pseudo=false